MSGSQPQAVDSRSKDVHLREYWKVLWQGRYTAIACFAVVFGLTLVWTFLQTPIYRATATVQVKPQARRLGPGQDVSGLGMSGYGWLAEERFQNTQLEIVRSRAVIQQAFDALGLDKDPRFAATKDPVAAFGRRFTIAPRRETDLIDITVDGPDQNEIAQWTNAVADAFVKRNFERAQDNAQKALDQLRALMGGFRQDLTDAEKQRVEMLKETSIYSPDSQQAVAKLRLEKLNGELAKVQIDLGQLGSLLAKIHDLQRVDGDPMTVPDLQQDAVLQELDKKKVQLESEFQSVKVTYRPGAPQYLQKESEIGRVKQGIRDQIAVILGRIQNQYDLAQQNEKNLKAQIRDAEGEAFRLGLATSKYDVAKTDADSKQQLFAAINKTMNEVAISSELLANNVSILDRAVPPAYPIKPAKRLNLFLGAMFGLLLGVGVVFFLDYLDTTLRSPDDIERYLRLTTLAVVPKHSGNVDQSTYALKEAFQSLRTGLLFSSANRKKRVVLITSTAPKEGKSSTAAQLARTLAGAGDRVVIVDCDLRKPTQQHHQHVERDPGLTNYIVGTSPADDWRSVAKQHPDYPALSVITSGPIPPNPPELLGSERFRELLLELRRAFDWVVLDSPPSASLSDAIVLSSLSDIVVMVVRHNVTDRAMIARSVQAFRNIGANVVGAVLNNVDLARAYKKDQYYAGYYYYGSDREESKAKRKTVETEA